MVRWCQIRRIWRVINQFKATVTHSSRRNHRLVCRSIVLVKQDSLRHFFRPFTKCLYHFSKSSITYPACVYIWKKTIQLASGKVGFNTCMGMHARFKCCGTTMTTDYTFFVSLYELCSRPTPSTFAISSNSIQTWHIDIQTLHQNCYLSVCATNHSN